MSIDTVSAPPGARFRTALISTAGHCAVACGFCFRAERAHGFLNLNTYTRALSRLKELGVEGVCLTGGEPTHHPKMRQLVRLARQFGLPVSLVTSARTPAEVIRLGEIAHLLANVTVSADSENAMQLGRTNRSVASGVAVLQQAAAPAKVLHVTYWHLTDDECRTIHQVLDQSGIDLQLSPVSLDEAGRRRVGLTLDPPYLDRQRKDAELLSGYFRLSPRFHDHLAALRTMQIGPAQQHTCRSAALYVTASGGLRRCPYGRTGATVHDPRAEISRFLAQPTQDRITPDCAAICRAD